MSLNHLAWEMSEKLGFVGVDPSVLSRVLKGQRMFSQTQLETFCKILDVLPEDKENLFKFLHESMYSKFKGRYFLDFEETRLIELAENNLVIVNDANEKGFNSFAQDWSKTMIQRIKEHIHTHRSMTLKNKMIALLFEYLNNLTISVLRNEMPKEAMKSIWKSLEEMLVIGKRLGDSRKVGLVYTKMGDVLNLVGGETGSRETLLQASRFFEKSYDLIDPNLRLYTLGELALNEAYLRRQSRFNSTVEHIYKLIPGQGASTVSEAHSLVARGRIALGESRGIANDFTQAWKFYSMISKENQGEAMKKSAAFRKVQISRSEIEAASRGWMFRDRLGLREMAIDCLASSKHLGYKRYFETTKQMVVGTSKVLNLNVTGMVYGE